MNKSVENHDFQDEEESEIKDYFEDDLDSQENSSDLEDSEEHPPFHP